MHAPASPGTARALCGPGKPWARSRPGQARRSPRPGRCCRRCWPWPGCRRRWRQSRHARPGDARMLHVLAGVPKVCTLALHVLLTSLLPHHMSLRCCHHAAARANAFHLHAPPLGPLARARTLPEYPPQVSSTISSTVPSGPCKTVTGTPSSSSYSSSPDASPDPSPGPSPPAVAAVDASSASPTGPGPALAPASWRASSGAAACPDGPGAAAASASAAVARPRLEGSPGRRCSRCQMWTCFKAQKRHKTSRARAKQPVRRTCL